MPVSTATVETLTAEVRVLMVGSRQVTLSVYNQLDCLSLGAVKPFGRVRLRGDAPQDGEETIRVVGADRDGRLCASWLRHSRWTSGYHYQDPGGWYGNDAVGESQWDTLEELPLIVLAGLR